MLRPRYAAISGKSSADGLDELGAAITAKICKYGARAVSQSGAARDGGRRAALCERQRLVSAAASNARSAAARSFRTPRPPPPTPPRRCETSVYVCRVERDLQPRKVCEDSRPDARARALRRVHVGRLGVGVRAPLAVALRRALRAPRPRRRV